MDLEECMTTLEEKTATLEAETQKWLPNAEKFLKSYQKNKEWILDMFNGDEEYVNKIISDIIGVIQKYHFDHVSTTTYAAVMFALQTLHLSNFSDFSDKLY